ncbi:hypothetical protein AUP68_05626 [Ilyonectria robusta]
MAPTDAEALKALNTVIETAATLLQQLQTVLGGIQKNQNPSIETKKPEASNASAPPSGVDALALARDSTALIKAHSTKLSLLIINEPFTPSAISTVVRELVTGPIPGLASSIEVCDTNIYTSVLRRELAWRAQRVFVELGGLLQRVPKDGKIVSGDKKDSFGPGGKGSLASTGVLWSACDDVIGLANMGVGGFFVKKAQEWRDTLKDDMLDDLMSSQQAIPRDDPDGIRPRLETSLKRLRLIVLLYQAISKRRFKKLPSFPPTGATSDIPQRLDKTAKALQQLPDKFSDLATTFYDMDPEEIDEAMTQAFADAHGVSELLSMSWDGSRDEFTEWTEKFQAEIKKA